MSEMVERVAKAIYESIYDPDPRRSWESFDMETGLLEPEQFRLMARAAIKAMREPTPPMIVAFLSNACCAGYVEEGWTNAMDEALR